MTAPVNARPVVVAAAGALTAAELTQFLSRQRWFAAKGGAVVESARISGLVPLPWGDGTLAIARVSATLHGREQAYQLPLSARPVSLASVPAQSVIATPTIEGRQFTVSDAVDDAEFQRGLARALATGIVVEGDTVRWVIAHEDRRGPDIPANAEIIVASAEQSNTSIIFDHAVILKLFRRLEAGPHPDIDVSRFLTRARFTGAPTMFATLRFEELTGGPTPVRIVTGLVQEYLPRATDAWTHATRRSASYFNAPRGAEPQNDFPVDANALGVLTRDLHAALASDQSDWTFAPEPATAQDLDRWAHRAQQAVRDGLSLLERQLGAKALPAPRAAEAEILVKRRERYLDWVNELADGVGDDLGKRIRVHGDYHLGQLLRAESGQFVVIDFEGEPTRPLAERCEKTSPLRDVAGMLRSFAYAAATLGASIEKSTDMATRELRSGRWERDARGGFLAGYLSDTDALRGLLPDEAAHVNQLTALFETEKVFYELAYELNHRPDWAWIPMRGISKLLVGQEDRRTGGQDSAILSS